MALAKIVIATFFAVALAKPLTGPGGQEGSNSMSISGDTRLGHAAAQCGNGQVISCCNAGNSQSTGGLIGSLGDGVLGGNCDSLDVTVLGVSVPLSSACSGQVGCCTGNTNGLVNVECTNVGGL